MASGLKFIAFSSIHPSRHAVPPSQSAAQASKEYSIKFEDIKLVTNILKYIEKNVKWKHAEVPMLVSLYLGLKELKEHLQSKFKDGMNWNNYGQWHVAHIIPCAHFNLVFSSQQKACFHYSNLQPLWAEENIKKRDKLNYEPGRN